MNPPWQLTATDLAAAIRHKHLMCREIMDIVLERIEQFDGSTNAFAFIDPDAARSAADDADRAVKSGGPLAPLHGIPISAKDLISTAGMRTAYGSRVFSKNVPTVDAEAIARVRRAGGIVFGKTTTPELGCKVTTDSPLQGITRNPWGLTRTPGGSSGGAAVAAAMGFGPLAITTDGAGSSRIPAACCGVVGLKPTRGAIPMELAADVFGGLASVGVIARTAADIKLLFKVMTGSDTRDPWTLGGEKEPYRKLKNGFDGLRIQWFNTVGNHAVDDEVERLTTSTVTKMANAGADVQEGSNAFDWALDSCRVLMRTSQAARYKNLLDGQRDQLDPYMARSIEDGISVPQSALAAALLDRSALFQSVQLLFDSVDVLVMPTVAAPPPPVSQRADAPLSVAGAEPRPLRESWFSYCIPFNVTGHPAISIPCGWTQDGMPVGLQIVGPWYSEPLLINLALAMEPIVGWREHWPPTALPSTPSGDTSV